MFVPRLLKSQAALSFTWSPSYGGRFASANFLALFVFTASLSLAWRVQLYRPEPENYFVLFPRAKERAKTKVIVPVQTVSPARHDPQPEKNFVPAPKEIHPVRSIILPAGERLVASPISNSFYETAAKSGIPPRVIGKFTEVMTTRVNFRRDIRAGDTFAAIFSSHPGRRETVHELVAASLQIRGRMLAAIRVTEKGRTVYVDEEGKEIQGAGFHPPLTKYRVSSAFSKSRMHPLLKIRRAHYGVDLAAPAGAPVYAAADGIVRRKSYSDAAGYFVVLAHGKDYATSYLHLQKLDSRLKKGALVKRGQIIGRVGMSGLATGPHLHFSLYDGKRYLNPLQDVVRLARTVAPKAAIVPHLDRLRAEHQQVVALRQATETAIEG